MPYSLFINAFIFLGLGSLFSQAYKFFRRLIIRWRTVTHSRCSWQPLLLVEERDVEIARRSQYTLEGSTTAEATIAKITSNHLHCHRCLLLLDAEVVVNLKQKPTWLIPWQPIRRAGAVQIFYTDHLRLLDVVLDTIRWKDGAAVIQQFSSPNANNFFMHLHRQSQFIWISYSTRLAVATEIECCLHAHALGILWSKKISGCLQSSKYCCQLLSPSHFFTNCFNDFLVNETDVSKQSCGCNLSGTIQFNFKATRGYHDMTLHTCKTTQYFFRGCHIKNSFLVDHIHFIFHRKYFFQPMGTALGFNYSFFLLLFKHDDSEDNKFHCDDFEHRGSETHQCLFKNSRSCRCRSRCPKRMF